MNVALVQTGLEALGFALAACAAAAGAGALMARSAFAMVMWFATCASLAAAAALAFGAGDGALALALSGVVIAPVLFLAGLLLSSPAMRPARPPWISLAAGAIAIAAVLWASPELLHTTRAPVAAPVSGLWFGVLIVVAALTCAGALGYGERGVLDRKREGGE